MSATPARDALTAEEERALIVNANSTRLNDLIYDAIEANVPEDVLPGNATTDALFVVLDNPDLVLAALIESDWRPDDDQLRAMGGTRHGKWCRTHDRRAHGFTAATCPHDASCEVVGSWDFPKERNDG